MQRFWRMLGSGCAPGSKSIQFRTGSVAFAPSAFCSAEISGKFIPCSNNSTDPTSIRRSTSPKFVTRPTQRPEWKVQWATSHQTFFLNTPHTTEPATTSIPPQLSLQPIDLLSRHKFVNCFAMLDWWTDGKGLLTWQIWAFTKTFDKAFSTKGSL